MRIFLLLFKSIFFLPFYPLILARSSHKARRSVFQQLIVLTQQQSSYNVASILSIISSLNESIVGPFRCALHNPFRSPLLGPIFVCSSLKSGTTSIEVFARKNGIKVFSYYVGIELYDFGSSFDSMPIVYQDQPFASFAWMEKNIYSRPDILRDASFIFCLRDSTDQAESWLAHKALSPIVLPGYFRVRDSKSSFIKFETNSLGYYSMPLDTVDKAKCFFEKHKELTLDALNKIGADICFLNLESSLDEQNKALKEFFRKKALHKNNFDKSLVVANRNNRRVRL